MTVPSRQVCISCHKGSQPDTLFKAMWHTRCNGEYGTYPGWEPKQCQCDCATSRKLRGAK